VIPGERADEPMRELAADHSLEAVFRPRGRVNLVWQSKTVIEKTAHASSVSDGRRLGHGPLVIDVPLTCGDPWRE
jgi:hypothetical protein